MSDEIVRRLMKSRCNIKFLNEDINHLNEDDDEDEDNFDDATGADEEYAALNDEEEEHDDSQAPIQGSPDDDVPDESSSEEDMSDEDTPSDDIGASSAPTGGGSIGPRGSSEEPEVEDMPEEPEPELEENPTEYENPLDNQYAVKFTLGDEVSLTATGTKNSDIKKGTIEGYDPEGFYKVKWSDESTTNGLTDIALEELVKKGVVHESKCVCGCKDFVEEDGQTVCDKCGRMQESTLDALTVADKSRPKGKRMIRSEAHPVSTAVKPNIAETIRNAFRGESIREDDDPDEEIDDTFSKLKSLDGEFWTRQKDLQKDIEDLGYTVDEINDEYVIVSSEESEDDAYLIPIEGTSRTFYINLDKSRNI